MEKNKTVWFIIIGALAVVLLYNYGTTFGFGEPQDCSITPKDGDCTCAPEQTRLDVRYLGETRYYCELTDIFIDPEGATFDAVAGAHIETYLAANFPDCDMVGCDDSLAVTDGAVMVLSGGATIPSGGSPIDRKVTWQCKIPSEGRIFSSGRFDVETGDFDDSYAFCASYVPKESGASIIQVERASSDDAWHVRTNNPPTVTMKFDARAKCPVNGPAESELIRVNVPEGGVIARAYEHYAAGSFGIDIVELGVDYVDFKVEFTCGGPTNADVTLGIEFDGNAVCRAEGDGSLFSDGDQWCGSKLYTGGGPYYKIMDCEDGTGSWTGEYYKICDDSVQPIVVDIPKP